MGGRNKTTEKKKSGKKNKKKGGLNKTKAKKRGKKKCNKKNGCKPKKKCNKKNGCKPKKKCNKKNGCGGKKNPKGKKPGASKQSCPAGEADAQCFQNAISSMVYEQSQIANFLKQAKLLENHERVSGNKGSKSGEFHLAAEHA